MTDIVEYLRGKINPLYVNILGCESHLYKECADEIERLRKERDELVDVLRQASDALELVIYPQQRQKDAITALTAALAKLGADKGEQHD